MNEVISVSSPNARKKTGKLRTQLALNSFTDSPTESSCQSFRITDFIHVAVVQLLSCAWLFVTPWTAACQASLSFTIAQFAQIQVHWVVMLSNYLILCGLLLILSLIFPSIRVFSSESVLPIRWPKDWSFSFSISPLNEYSGSISFRMDWRLDWSPCSPRDSQESSPAPQFESVNSSVLSLLYGSTLTSVHDYWENHSFDYQTVVSKVGTHMKLLFNLSHTPGSWRK